MKRAAPALALLVGCGQGGILEVRTVDGTQWAVVEGAAYLPELEAMEKNPEAWPAAWPRTGVILSVADAEGTRLEMALEGPDVPPRLHTVCALMGTGGCECGSFWH